MKIKFTEKDISILKVVSQIAGGFSLIVALTMIFSLVQLKIINPLDNPVLLSVKEQFDKDPANAAKAEQVRAMDLMARKAYFIPGGRLKQVLIFFLQVSLSLFSVRDYCRQ